MRPIGQAATGQNGNVAPISPVDGTADVDVALDVSDVVRVVRSSRKMHRSASAAISIVVRRRWRKFIVLGGVGGEDEMRMSSCLAGAPHTLTANAQHEQKTFASARQQLLAYSARIAFPRVALPVRYPEGGKLY